MVKALARILVYKPIVKNLNGLIMIGYDVHEIDWKEMNFRGSTSKLVDRMIVEASRLLYCYGKEENSYMQALVEAPGIVVWEGEGGVKGVDTILYPLMARLEKIVLYRQENEKLVPFRSINVNKEFYVYDGRINLLEDTEFDAIGLFTDKGLRILMREELKLPVRARPKTLEKPRKQRKVAIKRKTKKPRKRSRKRRRSKRKK